MIQDALILEEAFSLSRIKQTAKKNLQRNLKEHINDFQQVLRQEATAESLFARLTGNEDLVEVVNSHQALLGILLGYGRENAWLFYQKDKLRSMSRFAPPMKKDDSIDKQLAQIVQKADSFSEDLHEWKYILKCPRLPLPHFMADPNSLETKKLKKRYEKERQKMKKLFAQENYVEATLQKLMDN